MVLVTIGEFQHTKYFIPSFLDVSKAISPVLPDQITYVNGSAIT